MREEWISEGVMIGGVSKSKIYESREVMIMGINRMRYMERGMFEGEAERNGE